MTRGEHWLLNVCCELVDQPWLQGRLVPELGLQPDQVRVPADAELGALQIEALERGVEQGRFTLIVASDAAYLDRMIRFTARLAEHAGLETGAPRLIILVLTAAAAGRAPANPGADPASQADAERLLAQLPLSQRARVGLICFDEASTTAAIARLREMLALPAPVDRRPDCPYRGLAAFDDDHGDLLFGRDRDCERLLDRIGPDHRRVLVTGGSGIGKTSLLRAKVLPALRAEGHVVQLVGRGGRLVAALRSAIDTLEVPGLGDALEARAAAARRGLGEPASGQPERPPGDLRHRVVAIDALEEVFAEDPASCRELLAALRALSSLPWCTVIACLRADFLERLHDTRDADDLLESQCWVPPIDEAGLRAAIVEPALRAGVHVDPALVERLVCAVADCSSVPLPLLQVTLNQLWTRLRWRYLALADYDRIVDGKQRGIAAALALHAERVMQRLRESGDLAVARRILLDLIYFDGPQPTRRRRTVDELRRDRDAPGQFARVLGVLIDGRLIAVGDSASDAARWSQRRGAAGGAGRYVDLAHDALIKGWPGLDEWITRRRDDLHTQRRLEARAATGALLSPAELAEFARWTAAADTGADELLAPSDAVRALVRRSTWVRRRRRAAVGIGLAAAAAVAAQLYVDRSELRQSVDHAMKSEMQLTETARALRKVPGGSEMRACMVQKSRERVEQLRARAELEGDQQRIAIAGELEAAHVALEQGRLDQASVLYRTVLPEVLARASADRSNAQAQRDLSVVYGNLGHVAHLAGKLDEARRWLGAGLAVRESLAAQYPRVAETQRDLAVVYKDQGELEVDDGKLADARAWLDRSAAILRELVAADPDQVEWKRDLLAVYDQLGEVAVRSGQADDARTWFDQAVGLASALAQRYPGNAELQRGLAAVLDKRGDVAFRGEQIDEARAAFDKAFEIRRRLAAAGDSNAAELRDLAGSWFRQGQLAQSAQRYQDARDWFDRAFAQRKQLADLDPSDASLQRELGSSLEARGIVAYHAGQLDDARGWFDRALAVRQALADAQPRNAVWQRDVCNDHVLVLVLARDRAEAMLHLGEARRIHEQLARDGALPGDAEFARLAGALAELGPKVAALP